MAFNQALTALQMSQIDARFTDSQSALNFASGLQSGSDKTYIQNVLGPRLQAQEAANAAAAQAQAAATAQAQQQAQNAATEQARVTAANQAAAQAAQAEQRRVAEAARVADLKLRTPPKEKAYNTGGTFAGAQRNALIGTGQFGLDDKDLQLATTKLSGGKKKTMVGSYA